MARDAQLLFKQSTIALATSLIVEIVVKQRTLTQEDVGVDLKEYLLGVALQIIMVSMLL